MVCSTVHRAIKGECFLKKNCLPSGISCIPWKNKAFGNRFRFKNTKLVSFLFSLSTKFPQFFQNLEPHEQPKLAHDYDFFRSVCLGTERILGTRLDWSPFSSATSLTKSKRLRVIEVTVHSWETMFRSISAWALSGGMKKVYIDWFYFGLLIFMGISRIHRIFLISWESLLPPKLLYL